MSKQETLGDGETYQSSWCRIEKSMGLMEWLKW
jgi:hypothetical protein